MRPFSFIIILLVLVFQSCRPSQVPMKYDEPPMRYGTVNCDLGDERWYGVVQSSVNSAGKLDMVLFKSSTGQHISMASIKLEIGEYQLNAMQTDSGDVPINYNGNFSDAIEHFYEVLQLDLMENYVQITDINNDKKIVTGNFQCAFSKMMISGLDSIPFYPVDTLLIRNGVFEAPF